jgi:hypothetical protein
MLKMRVALLGALAMLVTSGIAASVASAAGPYWHVAGSRFEIGTRETVEVAGTTELKATVLGLPIKITCEDAVVENSTINANGLGQGQDAAKAITFEKCKIPIPKGCATENIKTVPVKSHLVIYTNGASEEKIGDLFEPTTGTEFTTITVENNGTEKCALAATYPVKGTTVGEVKPEGTEATSGELTFPTSPIAEVKKEGAASEKVGLEIGSGNKASFSGKFAVKLVTGGKFGAFKT